MSTPYRRKVGSARPSHLMFTGGVGGLVELPNFTVLVAGLAEWNYSRVLGSDPVIHEPRVLAAARSRLKAPTIAQLRTPPWMEGQSSDPNGPANQVGVPVTPFPAWFRCTYCDLVSSLESGSFTFTNKVASRPFEAQFSHVNCARRDRFAVPARFLVGCLNGHLDEFPYDWFVHRGASCAKHTYPALKLVDFGRESAANVQIKCVSCEDTRNMQQAQGEAGKANLPGCRGRHPHLGWFDENCDQQARLLVLGASNQWFGVTVNGLSVPPPQASELKAVVDLLWEPLSKVTSYEVMVYAHGAQFADQLGRWPIEDVWAVVEERRNPASDPESQPVDDLLTPEWQLLTSTPPPEPSTDFAVTPVPLAPAAVGRFADVRQVERLRLVRALVGFTRFDAPDPEDSDLVQVAPLTRGDPTWLPATEVRGEGLFVRLDSQALSAWESRAQQRWLVDQHRSAFAQFRRNRYSDRLPHRSGFEWALGWPGIRYYLIHSLSHIVLRGIALECGYAAASLAERVYADHDGDMAGFLIYTAVPDAEGTLGGLISLGEPDRFEQVLTRALRDARSCSSDPLCAESAPAPGSDACYAACCHVCMFLSETSCERGNRFLDRRLLVDLGRPELAFWS